MTRRHSLVTRALALVLALVLIASNGAGLTLGAKAAETGNLFDLMSENGASNEKLDAVLAYADFMPELKALNIAVEYEEAPTAAVGTLRQGTLTVKEIGSWVPNTWLVNNAPTPFNGVYSVDVGVEAVNVTYKQDLDVADEIAAVHNWVSELAAIPAAQAAALGTLSTGNKLQALKALEGEFIYYLGDDVDALTAEQLNIELTAEDLGISTHPKDYDIPEAVYDKDGDGVVDEDVQAEIDAQVQVEIDKAVAEELATVKEEFKAVINKLMNCLVTEDDPYAVYPDYKGNPGAYVDYLRIYGMMDQYSKQGLPFYYENADEIVTEMEDLSVVLGEILGTPDPDTGINYYEKAMEVLLVEYGVSVGQLQSLKTQMDEGAAILRAQEANLSIVSSKIDMANCEDLQGLLDALAACGTVSGVGTEIVMVSTQLEILDDSWKYIQTTVNGTPVNYKVETDHVLTEADVEAAIAVIEAAAPHYDVDTSAVKALVGTKMSANVTVECSATPKTYTVAVEGGESFTVSGDATELVLPFQKNHEITYTVNGETKVVTDEESAAIAITVEDLNKIATGEYEVVMVEDIDLGQVSWEGLVSDLNEALGREAFVLDGNTLIATITMGELGTFGKVVFNNEINSILLNGQTFLSVVDNSYVISIQALIDALLADSTFTSQKLIDLGTNGSGNLLNSTIEIFESEKNFVLNLPSVPAQMGTVAKGLNAVKDYMWFDTNNGSGKLAVSVNLPEKVYEAYLTAAIVSGQISDNDAATLNNKVAMEFVADYMELLVNSDANTTTFQNTLSVMGVERDLTGYEDYYQMLKKVAVSDNFAYTIAENTVDFDITGNGSNIKALLEAMGFDYTEMTMGQDVIDDYEELDATAVVTLVNDAPKFEALVIDPARLNDTGAKAKILAANYVTDLTTAAIQGPAAIMLLGNVDGNLTFDRTTILDLNGFTVNGSITANAPLYIVDSSMETVSGAGVTGSVTGDVRVLAGTYPNADVSGFIKDGYYMDGNSVVNAMYRIENGEIVVDANLYLDNVTGYLPTVHYMAADIAIDLALNYYFAAGLDANGNEIYGIEFNDLVDILATKDIGNVADQTLACIDAPGISAFINEVIADLLDFASIHDAIESNTSLGSYTFTTYPWTVAVRHETNGDYVTVDVLPSTAGKSYTLNLTVKTPDGNIKNKVLKVLNVLANRVVADETNVEVTIDQPVRDGKNLVVGGSGTATITLDFSNDDKYNRMLAGVLAYFNDGLTDELVDNGCIIDLNQKMAVVTVGEFFTAVKGVIENKELDFAAIAAKLNVTFTEAELAKLESLYDDFQVVCTKIIDKFDLTTNSTAPLSELANGDGEFIVQGDIHPYTADIYRRGFGLIANLGYTDATLVVRLAPKCTQILGDANSDGLVDSRDAALIMKYEVGLVEEADLHLCVSDVNGDGFYDSRDAALIMKFEVGIIPQFPVEIAK